MLRKAARYLYAPAMMVGMNGAAVWIVAARGMAGVGWLLPLFALALSLSFLVERWIPYAPEWNVRRGDLKRDIAQAVTTQTITLAGVLMIPVAAHMRPWRNPWPYDLPLWVQVVMSLFIADAGVTLAHYLSHRIPWLWPFHAGHHSPERMYGLNGLIRHPIQQMLEIFMASAVLIAMGLPIKIGYLLAFAIAVQLLLQHSNADMRLGPLRYVLAVGPVHRRHHLRQVKGFGVNFGLFTNVWDYLLGVADCGYGPEASAGEIGLEDSAYPIGYSAQLAYPFTRPRPEAGSRPQSKTEIGSEARS
ncbi:MAG TPA: sterol desaturase family protein [Caulobacteraceae bacterium]|jgi:sterol desaturase/sphingolipid hydroxylase (fatty acid hydroxylase superfamily)|nr:sterol desaturase family protein [Caulobacteraceae bacterium]